MNVSAITTLIWFGLVATAVAQGTPSGKASSGAPSKAQLSEVRSLVHDLQARTEKLRDLMAQYRSLVEQRPQGDSGDQAAKWNTALERLLRRIDAARGAVVETKQRLDQSATGQLPTALAKDVANTRNEAEAQRAAAEQVLAKNKGASSRPSKRAAQAPPEKPAPPIPDDL